MRNACTDIPKDASSPAGTHGTQAGFSLAQVAVVLVVLGLIVTGIVMSRDIQEAYSMHAQIAQIARFDHAVADFHQKYNGLPGDLIAVMAERQGLPAGDGSPGHGDGDGNISPCNPGWQWHLGCETALFWSDLFVSGMISENFSADSRFTNTRLKRVGAMAPYLPQAKIAEGISIAVWNTSGSQPSPKPQLPYGNYYELSHITGVEDEHMVDDIKALTPRQAAALDAKMDDGMPLTGRVMVNGLTNWPKDSWGTLARPGTSACVYNDKTYNTNYFLRADTPMCHLAIRLGCCDESESNETK